MSMFNRRNAALGWVVWNATKGVAKHRAKDAVPAIDRKSKRPNKSAIFLGVATALGVAALLHRLSRGGPPPDETQE